MSGYGTTKIFKQVKIGVIGAPFNLGQRKTGVRGGPRVLRNTGFIQSFEDLGHDVLDVGDVYPDKQILPDFGPLREKNYKSVLTYNKKLSESVRKIYENNRVCITVGGDHSTGIGTIAGHSRGSPFKKLILMWIDAHPDINTGRTSPTGNMNGMPLPYLLQELKYNVHRPFGFGGNFHPCLDVKRLTYIGLRDVNPLEQKRLDDLGILHFGMRDLDKIGLPEVIARCLDHLKPSENRPLHMSFDINALDPTVAPSTGNPVKGGLSLQEGVSIVETAQRTGQLKGFDLVEVNPTIGTHEDVALTAEAAKTLILTAGAGVTC